MFSALLVFIGIVFVKTDSGNTPDFAVRLNNSFANNSKEGRLEIYYSGRWGTVCDDLFSDASARVACASLGFGYTGTVIGNRYGAGGDPIWLDNVNCTGTETTIERCPHAAWGGHNCGHSEDVSIHCECGDRYFSGNSGQISSPNFPLRYADNLKCNNYIRVTYGHTVVITFLAFNTEPGFDWLTITCASGNAFSPPPYSGSELPAVLTISSCRLVNASFYTDSSSTRTGFNLTYKITPDAVIGGITTRPSNAFPRSDRNVPIIFNCTTATKYIPWWTINYSESRSNYTLTNSACGVIDSVLYSFWLKTETLGPGSCNLIVIASTNQLYLLVGSVICTDSTLSSARAILAPIMYANLELKSTKFMKSLATGAGIIRDEEIKISCNPSFTERCSSPSLAFTYFLYSGGPFVQMRILRSYWTSEGKVVRSTNLPNASSYVLARAPVSVIPPYTCNIVCDLVSSISQIVVNSPIEISFSTEPVEVLYWPSKNNIKITGDINRLIAPSAFLYCNAAANPLAIYKWIDESNGDITDGPTLQINQGGKYTCNASNIIRGEYYSQSKTVNLEACDDVYFSEPNGTISSPNYPNVYTNNLDCYSYISVSSGHTVSITFIVFNTQSDSDWVTISCAFGNGSTSPRYSGSQIPATLEMSSCNLIEVHFHTDSSLSYTGFSLWYTTTSVLENKTSQPLVSILGALLGVAIAAIIVLAVLLGCTCRRLKRNTAADAGYKCGGSEHELRQREGEGNAYYAVDLGNAVEVAESENDDPDDMYENVSGNAVAVAESENEDPDDVYENVSG